MTKLSRILFGLLTFSLLTHAKACFADTAGGIINMASNSQASAAQIIHADNALAHFLLGATSPNPNKLPDTANEAPNAISTANEQIANNTLNEDAALTSQPLTDANNLNQTASQIIREIEITLQMMRKRNKIVS